MADRPGQRREDTGAVSTAISTSTRDNATAFGFSITITGSFGVVQVLAGSPTVVEVLLFGAAAAMTLGLLEAAVTEGFRTRAGSAPAGVIMLGTALNFLSVAAGIATAAGVASLLDATGGWPLAAAASTLVFLMAESAETLFAEIVQRRRGDVEAEEEEPEDG